MTVNRAWKQFEATYRAKEMKVLTGWILAGESGSVVGLLGSGRSNLLGFLCYRPEVIRSYLPDQAQPIVLVPVDLNDLPAHNLATLYRVILRSFYKIRDQFDPTTQRAVVDLYQDTRSERDPFLPQSALHELLLLFQTQQIQVVLVLNRFASFCQLSTPHMINTLRSLRDNYKDTLCYIVGMHQEVAYLPDPEALGDMYDLLDSRVCWVGAMTADDARNVVARATRAALAPPTEAEVVTILRLAGNFPSLLKTISSWWLTQPDRPPIEEWDTVLLTERSIQHRLARLWEGLTQEEQLALFDVQKVQMQIKNGRVTSRKQLDEASQSLARQHQPVLKWLTTKGLCISGETGWQIVGDLLTSYVGEVGGRGRGKIWLDDYDQVYQGPAVLADLTHLESELLKFLIQNPYTRHTKSTLIENTWPDETQKEGVTDEALQQLVSVVRKKIEPNRTKPNYLINWRGNPEGGYQFFPEGRPG